MAIFFVYLALAVGATWPLAARLGDHLFGLGTPPLNVWAMRFMLHQLARAPLDLFDGNVFYPYSDTLAFSEHLFVPALLSAPFTLATGNSVLGHNAVALLTLALAGSAMFALARALTGDAAAAFAAGVLYAFHTWNVGELARLQILSNAWFPLLLLALVRYFASPSWGAAGRVGLVYAVQSLSCMYWALYAPLVALPAAALLQWRARLPWRRLAPLGAAALTTGLVLAPFIWPYVRSARQLGFVREPPEPLALDRYLDVLPGNVLYEGWLGTARANQDAAHFLGFSALALALVGALHGRFAARAGLGRAFLVTLAGAGLVLSLGPKLVVSGHELAPGPYALLYEHVPGFAHVRYPERFSLLLVLALAPLTAAGLARLRPRLGAGGVLAVALLIYAEHFSAPLTLEPIPTGAALPPVYRRLAETDDARVTAEVPATRYLLERYDALPMYFSTLHWKRTVQGFTGYFPPTYNFARWRLHHWPEPETLAWLERFGVDTVIVGPQAPDPPRDAGRFRVEGPFPGGHRLVRLLRARGQGYAAPDDDEAARGLIAFPRDQLDAEASHPGAPAAVDGDPATAWSTPDGARRGESLRLRFGREVRLARLSLDVRPPYHFPTRLELRGYDAQERPFDLPYDRRAAYDRLFAFLLHRPLKARLDLDVAPTPVRGVRLRVEDDDSFRLHWTVSEVRVFAAP